MSDEVATTKIKELMVVNEEGLVYAKSIRRIPSENRWGEDCVK